MVDHAPRPAHIRCRCGVDTYMHAHVLAPLPPPTHPHTHMHAHNTTQHRHRHRHRHRHMHMHMHMYTHTHWHIPTLPPILIHTYTPWHLHTLAHTLAHTLSHTASDPPLTPPPLLGVAILSIGSLTHTLPPSRCGHPVYRLALHLACHLLPPAHGCTGQVPYQPEPGTTVRAVCRWAGQGGGCRACPHHPAPATLLSTLLGNPFIYSVAPSPSLACPRHPLKCAAPDPS